MILYHFFVVFVTMAPAPYSVAYAVTYDSASDSNHFTFTSYYPVVSVPRVGFSYVVNQSLSNVVTFFSTLNNTNGITVAWNLCSNPVASSASDLFDQILALYPGGGGAPGVIQSVNNTNVTSYHLVQNPGSNTNINIKDLEAGSNITLNDDGNKITINSSYPTIYKDGSSYGNPSGINFTGAGCSVSSSGYGVDVNIPGGGGSSTNSVYAVSGSNNSTPISTGGTFANFGTGTGIGDLSLDGSVYNGVVRYSNTAPYGILVQVTASVNFRLIVSDTAVVAGTMRLMINGGPISNTVTVSVQPGTNGNEEFIQSSLTGIGYLDPGDHVDLLLAALNANAVYSTDNRLYVEQVYHY